MRPIAIGAVLLLAGAALAAPPQPEPKSLGEVARRAREKREKASGTASKVPSPAFTNEDLTERNKAGDSNLSLPGGPAGSSGAGPATSESGSAGGPSAAPGELTAALQELEAGKAGLAKAEAELDAAKRVLSPFSTEYTQDPYRQNEATQKAQEAQAQIDVAKKDMAGVEERIARLRKQVELESMAGGGAPPSSDTSASPASTTAGPDP